MKTQQNIINANRMKQISRNAKARKVVAKVTGEDRKNILIDTFVAETLTDRKITFRIKGSNEVRTLRFTINKK